jgi:hypothetical protein
VEEKMKKLTRTLIVLTSLMFCMTSISCFIVEKKQQIFFPYQREGKRNFLETQTIIGYSSPTIQDVNLFYKILPTDSGLYLFGAAQLHDLDNHPSQSMKLAIIRTNQDGKYLWSKTLLDHYYERNTQSTFFNGIITDKFENVIVTGYTNDRFFFGRRVPSNQQTFILCLSKEGKTQWITFLERSKYNYETSITIQNNQLFFADYDYLRHSLIIFCLDQVTGKQLSKKTKDLGKELNNVQIYSGPIGWYLISRDGVDYTINIQSFTFEGNYQWTFSYEINCKEGYDLLNSIPVSLGDPFVDILPICTTSNTTHFFIGGSLKAYQTKRSPDNWNQSNRMYKSFLLAILPNGELDWKYETDFQKNASIYSIKCNKDEVIVVGQTSTQFLPIIKDSFQPKIAGGDDLYIRSFDMKGATEWATYLGGRGDEPFYHQTGVMGKGFYDVTCDLSDNRVVITSNTTSADYPIVNAEPLNKNLPTYSLNPLKEKQPPVYGVLSVFDTNGKIQWSSFYTTDATNNQLEKVPTSTITIPQDDYFGVKIFDVKINKEKIFCIGNTNDSHTLLYRPYNSSITINNSIEEQDVPIFINLLSIFKLK